MSAFSSFIKPFLTLITFIFILIGTVYLLIISKPESIIFVTNKILNEDYSIEFKEAKSYTNFLSPIVVLTDVSIRETNRTKSLKLTKLR